MREADSADLRSDTGEHRQYLTFELGDEEYGIGILRVQEIKGWAPVTSVPNAPPWFKGVMNLRGTVVPVVDLRLLFGMPSHDYTRFTVVIVVTVGARVAGLVVDAVSDVLDIAARDRVEAPDLGGAVDVRFLEGMAKAGDRLVSLLAIDHVLGGEDLERAAAAA